MTAPAKPTSSATVKFNFLAWAMRNDANRNLSATDLMVLSQLVVRADGNKPFPMAVATLKDRIGKSEASVRESVSRLKALGDITVIETPGAVNQYKINWAKAPAQWVRKERERYEASQGKTCRPPDIRGPINPAEGESGIPEGTPRHIDGTPLQVPKDISISSDHLDSTFPSIAGRETKSAFAGEKKEVRGTPLADHLRRSRRGGRAAVAGGAAHSHSNALRKDSPTGEQGPSTDLLAEALTQLKASAHTGAKRNASGGDDPFEEFVRVWPRPDKDMEKLRAAWRVNVVKAGVDPDDVIEAAEDLAAYYAVRTNEHVPYAGKWLKDQGWTKPPPKLSSNEQGLGSYFDLIKQHLADHVDPDPQPQQESGCRDPDAEWWDNE